MKIQNRIYKTELIEWQKVKDLQPDNLKIPYNLNYIKDTVKKFGVSKAYDVCEIKGQIYWLDGHTRTQIFYELINEGEEFPDKLTANFCKVKDKKEAIAILLEVHNKKLNPIDSDVLNIWIEEEDVEVDLLGVNIKIEEVSELAPRNIIGNNYEAERNIDNSDYLIVNLSATHLKKLELIRKKLDADDNKEAILKLIELYDN